MLRLTSPLVAVLLLTPLAAQAVHIVGPGGVPQIRDALAVATTGDVILVQPGTYAQFEAAVGVTIRAVTPGTVTVDLDPAFVPVPCAFGCVAGPTRFEPPNGQTVHVVGLDFAGTRSSGPFPGTLFHHVLVLGGRVTFDDCIIGGLERPALTVQNATVHLQDTTVTTTASFSSIQFGFAGMRASGSDVTAVHSSFTGASTNSTAFPRPGIELTDSQLHASDLTVSGGSSPSFGAPAIEVIGAAKAWISDSTLNGGFGQCAVTGLAADVFLSRCTLNHQTQNCSSFVASPQLLGVHRPAPLSPGATFALDFRTEPNGIVAVVAGPLGTLAAPTVLDQPLWLAAGRAFPVALILADANGDAHISWEIPTGPGITDRKLWFQGLSGLAFPLQTSTVAGGVAR